MRIMPRMPIGGMRMGRISKPGPGMRGRIPRAIIICITSGGGMR